MKSILLSLTFFLIQYFQLSSQESSSGYIRLGADSIYYETRGSGKVIILIHDGLLPSDVWDAQSAYFSKDYRVVRYDRRGYGRSSPSTVQFSHLEDLDALVTQLKIDSACLIGAHAGAINAGILKSRRMVISGAGHLIPLEQPEIFNKTVADFLK